MELIAPQAIRLERNKTENRMNNKASKRNIAFSQGLILHEDSHYRLVSEAGEIPFRHYLRLDNSFLSPQEAAQRIVAEFGFETVEAENET